MAVAGWALVSTMLAIASPDTLCDVTPPGVYQASRDSFIIRHLQPGWKYWVIATTPDGTTSCVVGATGTTDVPTVPGRLALTISGEQLVLHLPARADTKAEIFDVQGRKVWQRRFAQAGPGIVIVTRGRLRKGVYFAQVRAGGAKALAKVVVVK